MRARIRTHTHIHIHTHTPLWWLVKLEEDLDPRPNLKLPRGRVACVRLRRMRACMWRVRARRLRVHARA